MKRLRDVLNGVIRYLITLWLPSVQETLTAGNMTPAINITPFLAHSCAATGLKCIDEEMFCWLSELTEGQEGQWVGFGDIRFQRLHGVLC